MGDPLAGLVDGGTVFVQSPLDRPGGDLGVDPGRRPGPRSSRRRHPRHRPRHGRARPRATRRARTSWSGCRASRWSACSCAWRRSPTRPGLGPRRAAGRRRATGCERFFGKRGGAVVDANLELIAAAYDGLIDVTAAVPAASRRPPRSPDPRRPIAMTARTTRSTTVGELMTIDPIVVRADASADRGRPPHGRATDVSGLPVVDATATLVGVRQPDRPRSTRAPPSTLWANWPGLAVRHLMTQPALTVTPAMPRRRRRPRRWSSTTSIAWSCVDDGRDTADRRPLD